MTSILLYKTRCPECAKQNKDKSGDNLAVYNDGHSYCYSCGYTTGPNITRLKKSTPIVQQVSLPEDICTCIPGAAWSWLNKYFKDKDLPIIFWWSESKQSLLFPIYLNNSFVAYQARYFGDNPKHPKWISYGINEQLLITYGKADDTIILVEDLLSMYKVGRVHHAMCLFGSNISLQRLARLQLLGYTKVVIWLDQDKRYESMQVANNAKAIGLEATSIITELDPKEYDYEKINDYLKNI